MAVSLHPVVERLHSYSLENSNLTLLRVHSLGQCMFVARGLPCPIHAPTDHPMRGWEQTWSRAIGFGRVCPEHEAVHSDPDDLSVVWADADCDCGEG